MIIKLYDGDNYLTTIQREDTPTVIQHNGQVFLLGHRIKDFVTYHAKPRRTDVDCSSGVCVCGKVIAPNELLAYGVCENCFIGNKTTARHPDSLSGQGKRRKADKGWSGLEYGSRNRTEE